MGVAKDIKAKNRRKNAKAQAVDHASKVDLKKVARPTSTRPKTGRRPSTRIGIAYAPVTEIVAAGPTVTEHNGSPMESDATLRALAQDVPLHITVGQSMLTLSPDGSELVRRILMVMLQAHGERVHFRVSREQEFLSPEAVATELGVSRPYIYKLLDRGDLPFEQVGKHRRVPADAVAAYRQAQETHTRHMDEVAAKARSLAESNGEIKQVNLAEAIREAHRRGDLESAKAAHRDYHIADLARSLRRASSTDDDE